MKKTTLAALGGALLFTSSGLLADNLLDVYRLAKDNDPIILASEAGRKATNERVKQAKSALLPQFSASAGYSYSESETTNKTTGALTPTDSDGNVIGPDVPIIANSFSESDTTGSSYSLSLNQQIYDHSSWVSLRQSEKVALQADINHDSARQDLIIRVSEAYFNVLGAMDDVAFSEAETEAVEKELAQTKQRFEVGLIAMTDVHEAQSRYDSARANQIASQNGLDNAHEALQEITGRYHYEVLGLKDKIDPKNPEPADINQWVKEAEQKNLLIQASKIGLEVAKQSIDISQAGHYPTLGLSASYSGSDTETNSPKRDQFDDNGNIIGFSDTKTNSDGPSSSISVNFNWPIYLGGRINSQVRESQNLYVQASHNLEADHRSAVRATRSSYLGVVAAVSSVKARGQAVISAESALEATQAGFEVGTRTIVDVLLQTQILFQAKREYARARYDYILNTLRLKQAAGMLTEKDLEIVNAMLR